MWKFFLCYLQHYIKNVWLEKNSKLWKTKTCKQHDLFDASSIFRATCIIYTRENKLLKIMIVLSLKLLLNDPLHSFTSDFSLIYPIPKGIYISEEFWLWSRKNWSDWKQNKIFKIFKLLNQVSVPYISNSQTSTIQYHL